jgi:hypothetical protein
MAGMSSNRPADDPVEAEPRRTEVVNRLFKWATLQAALLSVYFLGRALQDQDPFWALLFVAAVGIGYRLWREFD